MKSLSRYEKGWLAALMVLLALLGSVNLFISSRQSVRLSVVSPLRGA